MLIYGTGGHARVVYDCLVSQGMKAGGFIEDFKDIKTFLDIPVFNSVPAESELIIAIGNNATRKKLANGLRNTFVTVTHKTSIISPKAVLGKGCMIIHGAVVQSNATIGDHAIVNTGAVVDHDCKLQDFVHVAPNSTLCEGVKVMTGAMVGAGAVVLPGTSIGAWSVVGGGSVVIKDVADGEVVAGNPACVLR